MEATALIVEDDKAIADLIVLYLSNDGIMTRVCESAEAARTALGTAPADLIILDINLPGMDGFEFLHELRANSTVPVIIVSARESDEDKVLGLGLGADDFVTKPFSPRVLAARARAQLRRVGFGSAVKPRLIFGPFNLDFESRTLERNGERVSLSRKEFELLAYLARKPGVPSRPEEIYEAVWGNNFGDLSTVGVHIQRLRRKIEDDPSFPRYLTSEHGFGYRLEIPKRRR